MFRTPVAQQQVQVQAQAKQGASTQQQLSVLRLSAQKKLGHVFVQLSSGCVLRYLPAVWQPH
ncbi:hypothetical protein H8J56_27105, partial [Klebsiella sp. Kps]|uniref:hypothetical protein n=1 Tax=Klebsiella sp. Kps TaxID=2758579 RepID=UPI00164684CD